MLCHVSFSDADADASQSQSQSQNKIKQANNYYKVNSLGFKS